MTDDRYGTHNLPYGVFDTDGRRRIGVRLGDAVLDLDRAESEELILAGGALRQSSLNPLMALGPAQWSAVRARIALLDIEAEVGFVVVPMEALNHAWTPEPVQDPPVADYLTEADRRGLDLRLNVDWNGTTVTITATAPGPDGLEIGFGEVTGTIATAAAA